MWAFKPGSHPCAYSLVDVIQFEPFRREDQSVPLGEGLLLYQLNQAVLEFCFVCQGGYLQHLLEDHKIKFSPDVVIEIFPSD